MAIVYNITNLTQFKTLIRSLEKRLIWSFCVRLDENLFCCMFEKTENNVVPYKLGVEIITRIGIKMSFKFIFLLQHYIFILFKVVF